MTTLVDIYEAAGATVSEDRTQVTMVPGQLKPFDIVLRVYPQDLVVEFDRPEQIRFGVVLHDVFRIGETTALGTEFNEVVYNVDITLPVSQVHILKKD